METVAIETLKKGTLFKKPGQKQVLIACGYCRFQKSYEYIKMDDIGDYGYIKKGKLVNTDFEY